LIIIIVVEMMSHILFEYHWLHAKFHGTSLFFKARFGWWFLCCHPNSRRSKALPWWSLLLSFLVDDILRRSLFMRLLKPPMLN